MLKCFYALSRENCENVNTRAAAHCEEAPTRGFGSESMTNLSAEGSLDEIIAGLYVGASA